MTASTVRFRGKRYGFRSDEPFSESELVRLRLIAHTLLNPPVENSPFQPNDAMAEAMEIFFAIPAVEFKAGADDELVEVVGDLQSLMLAGFIAALSRTNHLQRDTTRRPGRGLKEVGVRQ